MKAQYPTQEWIRARLTRTSLRSFLRACACVLSFLLYDRDTGAAAPKIDFGLERAMPGEYVFYGEYRHMLEHSPQVLFQGDRGVAVWHIVTGGDDVAWAYTLDGGDTWERGSKIELIAPQDKLGPPVLVNREGEFSIFTMYWMETVGRSPGQYVGPLAYVPIQFEAHQTTSGAWENMPFREGTSADQLFRAEVIPGSGDVVMTYTNEEWSGAGHSDTQIFFASLRDSVWSRPVAISNLSSQGARPLIGADGEVYAAWKDVIAAKMVLRRSDDGGRSFGPEMIIGEVYDNETLVPGLYNTEDRVYLPTEECEPGTLNFPSIAIDKSQGPNRGTLYAVWTDRVTGEIGQATRNVSEVEPNNVSELAMPIEVGMDVSGTHIASESGGGDGSDWYAFTGVAGSTIWIDGMVTGGGGLYPNFGTSLRLYGCFDAWPAGRTMALKTRGMSRERQQPPMIVTLPSTGRYEFLVPSQFESYRYRFRLRYIDPDPSSVARDSRDVVLVSSSDGGATWTPRVLVNDDPPRFDNYLPEVEVDGLGIVHVMWFDRRSDPACGINYDLYWTCSMDGGRTFVPSRQVNDSTNVVGRTVLNPPGGLDWRTSPRFGRFLDLALGGSQGGVYASWPQSEPLITFNPLDRTTDHDIHGRRIRVTPDAEVTDFRGGANGGVTHLEWRVGAPDFVWKFEVVRGVAGGGVGEVVGTVDGRSGADGEYRFTDEVGGDGGEFLYRIRTIRTDERVIVSEPLVVSASAVPLAPVVRPVAPNPSGSPVEFVIDSPALGDVTISVFDARGAEVRVLHRGPLAAGTSHFSWDGRNETGSAVPAGIYFVTALAGETRSSQKFVRVAR